MPFGCVAGRTFAELADKAKVREHQMELQNREDWVHMVEESVKKGEATVS